jgi:hypothetical protein
MQIVLALIATLSILVSVAFFLMSKTAMHEIVAAVVGLNFTIALAGIGILNKMDNVGTAAMEYMTKKIKSPIS